MSSNPERLRGGPDASAFESEFENDPIVARLLRQMNDASVGVDQVQVTARNVEEAEARYNAALRAASQSGDVLLERLNQLQRAYSAALDLKAYGALPSKTTLIDLEAEMAVVNIRLNGIS